MVNFLSVLASMQTASTLRGSSKHPSHVSLRTPGTSKLNDLVPPQPKSYGRYPVSVRRVERPEESLSGQRVRG